MARKVTALITLNCQEMAWEIIGNEPETIFTLVVVKSESKADSTSEVYRVNQEFDPQTDEGTQIVYAFGKPMVLVETSIFITAEIPMPDPTKNGVISKPKNE